MEQAANETIGDPANQDLAQVLADYAKAARGTAVKNRSKGDGFGDELATKRAALASFQEELRTPGWQRIWLRKAL